MQISILVASLIAYLIGSISSAIIICKLFNLPDPRLQGSRNPGTTNVLRIGGKLPALLTLFGDVLKGFLPVFVVKWLQFNPAVIAATAICALLGHLWPIYFRFEGGKGVATLLGCLIAVSWQSAICWGSTWIICALLFRYSSLAAIVASCLAPLFIWFFTGSIIYTNIFAFMSAMLLIRHKTNIQKLLAGTESKIGQKF